MSTMSTMSTMSSIKNFLVYLSIGLVSKVVLGNDISFFIASGLTDLTDPSFESRKNFITNIILIKLLISIYYQINNMIF